MAWRRLLGWASGFGTSFALYQMPIARRRSPGRKTQRLPYRYGSGEGILGYCSGTLVNNTDEDGIFLERLPLQDGWYADV